MEDANAITGKGTPVFYWMMCDCDENEGGWYVEIGLDENLEMYDYFCIHPDDCNCEDDDEVERFAKEYISNIYDY